MHEKLKEYISLIPNNISTHHKLEAFGIKLISTSNRPYSTTIEADAAFKVACSFHVGKATYVELRNAYHGAWNAKNVAANDDDFSRYTTRAIAIFIGWMHSQVKSMRNYNYIIVRVATLITKAELAARIENGEVNDELSAVRNYEEKTLRLFKEFF